MSTPGEVIACEYDCWVRVVTLIHHGGREICLDILHNKENFSKDGAQLYNALLPHQPTIQVKLNRKVIKQDQYDLIFPVNGITNPSLFDITLFTFLLQVLFGNRYRQLITDLRQWRNKEFHKGNITFTPIEFNTKWTDVINFLQQNGFDVTQVADLKSCPLDANFQYRNAHVEAKLLAMEFKFDKEILDLRKERIKDNNHQANQMEKMKDELEAKFEDYNSKDAFHELPKHRINDLLLESQKSTGEDGGNDTDTEKMNVISYVACGCIFKIQVELGTLIESVKIKCTSEENGFDWMDVKRNNNENSNDGCEVYYEVKDLDEETMLLKIENVPARWKYQFHLQTNQSSFESEDVIIYEEDSRTHVTNIDDEFITLTPPLGQFNDPQNCRHWLQKYLINDLTIRISDGTQTKSMNAKEFAEFSDAYRIRNFPNNKNVLIFLPLYMIPDAVIKQVANLFYQLLSDRHGFRAVVTNLDSNKYFQCCTETDDNLQTDLPYLNRIQVFDQQTASVLNVRVLEQTNFDGDVHKEMEHCITDMQYFVGAHRHHECCCYVIGILAFPNICRADLKSQLSYYVSKQKQSLLNLFYLSKEDLEDFNSLKQWWTDVFLNELKGLAELSFKVDSFQQICSQSITTIALAKLSPELPTLLSDTHLQINSLLLNLDQLEAIQSPSKHKIIIGNHGSGKSVVLNGIAKMKFRECLHTEKNTLLLYVVWEAYTLLAVPKNLFLEKFKKTEPKYSPYLKIISGNIHDLSAEINNDETISLLQFLQYYLQESGFDILHILIDELPTDAVHVTELETLNELLRRHPNSSVAIAPQSVVVDRTTSTKTEDKNHNRNCLDQMEMDRFNLKKVMRNSKQITAALNALQKKLHGNETVLSLYDPVDVNVYDPEDVNVYDPADVNDYDPSDVNVYNPADANVYDPADVNVYDPADVNVYDPADVNDYDSATVSDYDPVPVNPGLLAKENVKKINSESPLNVTTERAEPTDQEEELHSDKIQNLASTTQPQKPAIQPPIELSKISKLMDTEEDEKNATEQLKATYHYHSMENGNGITDRKPALIKLPSQVDFECDVSAKILTVTLEELCLKETEPTLMLCSSMEEIRMVSYCLSLIPNFKFVIYIPHLRGVLPSIEERKFVFSEFNDGSCLLTDNTGIKGMEAKRVIIFAEHDEYFESHLINEMMSRATVRVYILLRSPKPTVNKNRKTLGDTLEELETFGLFDVKQVTLYEDHLNYEIPFDNEDRQNFKVNKICELELRDRPTFNDYRTSFDTKFPGYHKNPESYRTKIQELTLFHTIHYREGTFDFDESLKEHSQKFNQLEQEISHHNQQFSKENRISYGVEENFHRLQLTASKSENDLEKSSQELKNYTKQRYENVFVTFEKSGLRPSKAKKREDIVVGLSLIKDAEKAFFQAADSYIAEEEISKHLEVGVYRSDTPNIILKKRNELEEVSSRQTDYNDIMKSSNDYVVISGAPGCGKTTLCETLAYNWACDKFWVGNPKFQFVFILKFRELNRFKNDQNVTAKGILSDFYPSHFNEKTTMVKNSLLILDGFDECFNKYDLLESESEFTNYTRALYDLLDPHNTKLPFARLVTSRPASCSVLFRLLESEQIEPRLFEVTGFSMENVKKYVRHYYQQTLYSSDVQQEKLNKFLEKVEDSLILRYLMTIPFYCNGVCCLMLESEIGIESIPLTYTGLFTTLLTLFLRNHGLRNSKLKLTDVLKKENTKQMILILSKFAFSMEQKRKITFTKRDFPEEFRNQTNIDELVDQTGLILKLDHQDEPFYQFVHYSFHEFLVALHLFHIGSTKFISNPYIISMVGGLTGGLVDVSKSTYLFVKKYALMFRPKKLIPMEVLLGRHDEISQFLAIVFEYQNKLHLKKHTIVRMSSTRGNILPQEHHVQHFVKSSSEKHIVIENVLIKTDLSCLHTHGKVLAAFTQSAMFKVLFVNGSYHPEEDQGTVRLSYTNSHFDKLISLEDTLIIAKYLDIASFTNHLEFIEHFDYDSVKDDIFKSPVGNVNLTIHMKVSEFVKTKASSKTKFEHYCKLFKSVTISLYTDTEQRDRYHSHRSSGCFPTKFIGEVKHAIVRNRYQLNNLKFAASCTFGMADGVAPSIRKI